MDTMIKSKLKTFFSLAQELESLAEENENFLSLVEEAQSELDTEEDYLLYDVVSFVNDLDSAIKEGYESIIDYWDEY